MSAALARLNNLQAQLLHGPPTAADPARAPHRTAAAAVGNIRKRPLFRGGPEVSCIGLGAWPLAGAHGPVGQG